MSTARKCGLTVMNLIACAGAIASFVSCYYMYYLPKSNDAGHRLELNCVIANISLYGGTCQTTQKECITARNRQQICYNEIVSTDCERAIIFWQFVLEINGTTLVKTDTRDNAYDSQQIGDNSTCWWNGALSFSSFAQAMIWPRVAISLVGILAGYTLAAFLLLTVGYLGEKDNVSDTKDDREVKVDKTIELIEVKAITASKKVTFKETVDIKDNKEVTDIEDGKEVPPPYYETVPVGDPPKYTG